MNKLILLTSVAIMTLGIASESWAVTSGCDCGSENNCCWKIEDGVLTIYPNPKRSSTGNVTMKNFDYTKPGTANGYTSEYSSNAPWARQGATSVVVENGISNIGNNAFMGDTKITSVSGMENVTSIDVNAFWGTSSLESVDMQNVTSIGNQAFCHATKLQGVDMPNVTFIDQNAFLDATSLQSIDMPNVTRIGYGAFKNASSLIYAGFDSTKIENIGKDVFYNTGVAQCSNSGANCGSCPSGQAVMPGRGCVADCGTGYSVDNSTNRCVANAQTEPTNPSGGDTGGSQVSEQQGTQVSGQATSAADCVAGGKYLQEGECVFSCGASFKLNDGWCDRIRYTPAEAAEVLRNDNTNEVTITFKK